MTGLPPTILGATQENLIDVVVMVFAVSDVGGLGFVMITAPLPAVE